jgi:hypothetical protein
MLSEKGCKAVFKLPGADSKIFGSGRWIAARLHGGRSRPTLSA